MTTPRNLHSDGASVARPEHTDFRRGHAEPGLEFTGLPTVLGQESNRGDQPTTSAGRDLYGLDPYTTPADPRLLDAALRCVGGEAAMDIAAMIGWAIYAFRVTRELYGPTDQRTAAATDALAAVISRHGTHGPPARLPAFASGGYAGLVQTRFSAVRALHERGLCDHGIREAQAALAQWADHDSAPSTFTGLYLLATLRVLDLCGRVHTARALLDTYRPRLPRAGHKWNLLAAELGAALLGSISAIVGHRPICTGQPETSGDSTPPRRRVYGEVRTMFLGYLATIADTPASCRPRPAATTNTGPFTGPSAPPRIGARPRTGPTRRNQSRPATYPADRRRGA